MAGLDTEFEGTAKLKAGHTVGFLSQEPPLNEEKDVAGNLDEAMQPIRDLIDRYNKVADRSHQRINAILKR